MPCEGLKKPPSSDSTLSTAVKWPSQLDNSFSLATLRVVDHLLQKPSKYGNSAANRREALQLSPWSGY